MSNTRKKSNKLILSMLSALGFCPLHAQSTQEWTPVSNPDDEEYEIAPTYGTGTTDYVNREDFQILNPVEDYLQIVAKGCQTMQVSIADISGKIVKEASLKTDEKLYMGDLQSGNYILAIREGEKHFSTILVKK
ncbi:MAG: T9SS type A sorting domain-containing protein [Paludibacteraceae bacterium]|nr:T9SS type A sorting domain-containing protein [Paludibacteraceae bacterium]